MRVRYIEETTSRLTKGKKYQVLSEINKCYRLINDNGDTSNYLKHSFEIVKSKQLKVGDALLAKDLKDWCKAGENYYLEIWRISIGDYFGNRTIQAIEIKDGHKAFLISNKSNVWIKAKGYRKFCKRNENVAKVNDLELKYLELKEAIEILKHFQQWRVGGVEHFAYSGNQLTEAINLIIEENEK